MACCGKNRRQFQTSVQTRSDIVPSHRAPSPDVAFQYAGTTALSVIGPITRRRYHFRAGERITVDARDASSLQAVPNLRISR